MTSHDLAGFIVLAAVTALLFAVHAYRRQRPLTLNRTYTGDLTPESQTKLARSKGLTQGLLVVAIATGLLTLAALVDGVLR